MSIRLVRISILIIFIGIPFISIADNSLGNDKYIDNSVLQKLEKSAQSGNPKAQYELGKKYSEKDNPSPQDYQSAVLWLEKSASQDYTEAQLLLGLLYSIDKGISVNYDEAARLFHRVAEKGNIEGMYLVALSYEYGKGVENSFDDAAYWYRRAAELGDPESQYKIGSMYSTGQGVSLDFSKAIYWFRRAAEQDNRKAQLKLATAYDAGAGVRQDKDEATYWYGKANGNSYSNLNNSNSDNGITFTLDEVYGEINTNESEDVDARNSATESIPLATIENSVFSATIPDDWEVISQSQLSKHQNELGEKLGITINNDYALQKTDANHPFAYPYILIQIENEGRPSAQELNSIPTVSTDDIPTILYDKNKADLPFYDRKNQLLWTYKTAYVSKDTPKIINVSAFKITNEGFVKISGNFFFEQYREDFENFLELVSSVELTDEAKYKFENKISLKEKLIDKAIKDSFLGLLFGMILAMLAIARILSRKEKN